MADHSNILENHTDAYFEQDADAYLRACAEARIRAQFSYFDQHVVRSSHGHHWVAAEAVYAAELPDFGDQIVFTVRSNRSDEDKHRRGASASRFYHARMHFRRGGSIRGVAMLVMANWSPIRIKAGGF